MFPVVLPLTIKDPLAVVSDVVAKLAAASIETLLPTNNRPPDNVVIAAPEPTWRS